VVKFKALIASVAAYPSGMVANANPLQVCVYGSLTTLRLSTAPYFVNKPFNSSSLNLGGRFEM